MNSYKTHQQSYEKPKEAILTAEENSKPFQTSHRKPQNNLFILEDIIPFPQKKKKTNNPH